MLAATSAVQAADERGVVQGVVSDASGQPVKGAFVKLKNAERRLTFMVITQDRGQFTAKDLPVGNYAVQGVGPEHESDWFQNVKVVTGEDAKVGLSLSKQRGPSLTPAWPKRLPEAEVAKSSKEVKDLPEAPTKALVAQKCTVCHDTKRIQYKRSEKDDWAFTVHRMRGIMTTQNVPDISDAQEKEIVEYLAMNYKPVQPYDPNSRLPRALMTGKATQYRVVTYDLMNKYAEPHDVASDPQGNAWVAERAGKVGRFDPKTLEFTERSTPPGPAPADRQRLGNPQINAQGIMWMPDGPNRRWLSFDTNSDKFTAYAWPQGHGAAGGNTMALHPDGTIWGTGAGKEARMLNPATGEFKFFEAPAAKEHKDPGAYGMAVAGDGSVWFAEDNVDLMARVRPRHRQGRRVQDPVGGQSLPASHELGRQWRSLGGAVERRQADEDRPQDPADDDLHAADHEWGPLLGHR